MRRVQVGFTVVELILTIAIVGIIAAILIPQFNKEINKNKSGITLGRAVEQLQTGCINMIQTANDNSNSFDNGTSLDTLTIGELYNATDTTLISESSPELWESFMGYKTVKGPNRRGKVISAWYYFNNFDARAQISPGEDNFIITIQTDTNSKSSYGINLFEFAMDYSCKMTPYGLDPNDYYKDNCKDGNVDKTCTARVVAEGYKINY